MEQRQPERKNERQSELNGSRPNGQAGGPPRRPEGQQERGERPNPDNRPNDHRQPEQRRQESRSGDPRQGDHRQGEPRQGEPRQGDPRQGDPRQGDSRSGDPRMGEGRQGEGRSAESRAAEARPSEGHRLVIGISLGDYNGIGPEVILKALQQNRLQRFCTPVIYGSMRILNRYRNLLQQAGFPMKDWNLHGIQQVSQANHKFTNVITCWNDQNSDIQPGKVTPEAGQAALACLQKATEDLKAGHLDALVTAPINKFNIQTETFKFPGHTEFLAEAFGVRDNLMFLVSSALRVGVVTGHVPLGRVRAGVTRERVLQKLNLMMDSLRQDFGIAKPRIAVLGLNPHAGEEGLLGNEEQDILLPLLDELRGKGQLVYGPFPSDGFFGTRGYRQYDAVLAMYHDQGLIPFKTIAFEEGVNFTAGMPAVRTSPDHGTAYDIAGKGVADETSMLHAIFTACDIARYRRESAEIEKNALKKTIQGVEK